jgi:hypothetical protein
LAATLLSLLGSFHEIQLRTCPIYDVPDIVRESLNDLGFCCAARHSIVYCGQQTGDRASNDFNVLWNIELAAIGTARFAGATGAARVCVVLAPSVPVTVIAAG